MYADALKAEPYDPSDLQRGSVQAYDATGEQATVTILPDEADRDETKFDDAVIGLALDESLLVAGPATRGADGAQTRPVLDVIGNAPNVGDRYGLTRDVWLDPEQAGLDSKDVVITTPDGRQFPAWEIPVEGSTKWAILTHGKGAARSEMLRMARPLHKAGYNVLIITYTGDVGAPAYDDGMVHYGRTEWQELQAAVEYVDAAGADTIVLGGTSHGGAVTLGFLERGELARRVDGVILDAPASSFDDVIDEAAEFRSLPVVNQPIPESLEDAAKLAVAVRYGVDFSAVDYSDKPELIEVPLLTFQGVDDRTVPKAVNDRFMREAGAGGTYEVVDGADHVLSWNVDPKAYEKAIREVHQGARRAGRALPAGRRWPGRRRPAALAARRRPPLGDSSAIDDQRSVGDPDGLRGVGRANSGPILGAAAWMPPAPPAALRGRRGSARLGAQPQARSAMTTPVRTTTPPSIWTGVSTSPRTTHATSEAMSGSVMPMMLAPAAPMWRIAASTSQNGTMVPSTTIQMRQAPRAAPLWCPRPAGQPNRQASPTGSGHHGSTPPTTGRRTRTPTWSARPRRGLGRSSRRAGSRGPGPRPHRRRPRPRPRSA